jgi:hypothetical protein
VKTNPSAGRVSPRSWIARDISAVAESRRKAIFAVRLGARAA